MQLTDFISGGKINRTNLKTFTKPFLIMVFIFILFVVLFRTGTTKITKQVAEYKNSKKTEETLSIKLSKLTEGADVALENTNKLVVALPQRNSVMIMISQIKRLAAEKNLIIGKLEISGLSVENELNSIQLQVQIDSPDIVSIMDYLKELPKISPVSSVFGIKISNLDGSHFIAKVELTVFWSDFPTTIPAVREPVFSLSESELKAMEIISNLREPEYQIMEPSTQSERTEPFN